ADKNDHIWVGNNNANADSVVELDNDGNYIQNVTVGRSPEGLAVDSTNDIWVTNYLVATVSEIILSTLSSTKSPTYPIPSTTKSTPTKPPTPPTPKTPTTKSPTIKSSAQSVALSFFAAGIAVVSVALLA